jgi:AbrB family looped-hinge helix DNA binding protein
MFESKITSKGRITIPKNIRDFLKIDTADTVVFIPLEDGKVLMTRKKNPVSKLFGMLRRRQQKEVVPANQMKEAVKTKRAQRAIQ